MVPGTVLEKREPAIVVARFEELPKRLVPVPKLLVDPVPKPTKQEQKIRKLE